jgi:UDP-N-acetylmuramoylalanine--D-glutamate ligase
MKFKPKTFNFCGHKVDYRKHQIIFNYRLEFSNHDSLEFTETITCPGKWQKISPWALEKFLQPLELILGISYYRLYCPPKIKTSFGLSREQAEFWNTVYQKGLGEFCYRNKINPSDLAKFPHAKIQTTAARFNVQNCVLLGIGGGKDSIVAAELLRGKNFSSFIVETQRPDEVSVEVAKKISQPILKIQRQLDPKIFVQHEGAYNGHVPISAIWAFLGLLSAALYDYQYFVVGNEHSSNFGNLEYLGQVINHQWSKSVEFEKMFQEYTRRFITPDITYFSLLRQFYEIRIAKMFAAHKKYFSVFSSCNKNFRAAKDRPASLWCGECPKCAFVFLMLASFLSKKDLLGIFKKNLFDQENLLPLFCDLLGLGDLKPFDCVGTFEEARTALVLAAKKYPNSLVIKKFLSSIKKKKDDFDKVFKIIAAPTTPTPFRFLGLEKICLLGYGREGQVTEKYLKKNYPHLKIGVLDQTIDKDYLVKQGQYELAVKTPGIPMGKVTIPYVTATNLFLSQTKNFVIGVTGSKGKSTTVSLIYKILKTAGKKVRLIGNIGLPMLEVLLGRVDPEEIFVVELSSYMLEDVEYSPNVAVLLNLFPEHMNYHGCVEKYYQAKKNIFKFQKPGDVALRPPFNEGIPLSAKDIPLFGAHNRRNIQAAIAIARVLKISDAVIKKAIKNFQPLPHRLEFVGEFKGIKFYDDAISTTPESTIAALETLKGVETIFLGGEDRGYDFSELEKKLRAIKIKNIVLFPESGRRILKSRKGFNVLETKSMKKAVEFAFRYTPKGKTCLLSTASPSYSIWKNFEEKGDLFQKFVRNY